MIEIKKTIIPALATTAVLLVTGIILSSATSACDRETDNRDIQPKELYTVSPEVPREIIFAGEKIQLTLQNRHERMDREIMSFTYSHINTMLQIKRANRLFPIVEPILKECGVPDDFKYLMIIESNGDIEARSPAGAGGLWQFLEKTGREYGLEVNKEIDERYNIEKATRAACGYLKESYAIYGDWITVAASYNTGRTNVNKRIEGQKEKKSHKPSSAARNITLHIPSACSKDYLHKSTEIRIPSAQQRPIPTYCPQEHSTHRFSSSQLGSFCKRERHHVPSAA